MEKSKNAMPDLLIRKILVLKLILNLPNVSTSVHLFLVSHYAINHLI